MPQQVTTSVQNNFTKGLVTEFTGLNFPENASTDCDNVEFSIIGDVARRVGIDAESNYSSQVQSTASQGISTYVWNNAGGDGNSRLVVKQIGGTIYFYNSSNATESSPLSSQLLGTSVSLSSFLAYGGTLNLTNECQYADGNGYLFIYHPNCDPIYVTYTSGVVTGRRITIETRDFRGVDDGLAVSERPPGLSSTHLYNLQNQGWVLGSTWGATSTTTNNFAAGGSLVFTVAAGLTITPGENIVMSSPLDIVVPPGVPTSGTMTGTVASYAGTTLTVNITSLSDPVLVSYTGSNWSISPSNVGPINTWFSAVGVIPSNADVWWYYKDNTGVFNPAVTADNVTVSSGRAPQGHYILQEFYQNRAGTSSVSGMLNVTTTVRPRTGCWFQGRVWYTGTDNNFPASSNALAYSWTENIYFSKVVTAVSDFGVCYQQNDPTSENFFDLLPTDGGVIVIQGCGSIHKLFPIQNGLLVFASNGVWFITGSQGIGFTANDYTITKISSIRSISSTSFVDVNGLPYFWNEEGIYNVEPAEKGGLSVESITVSTILSFYSEIPLQSKKYVRGSYDPINYTIRWIYRDSNETSSTDRYYFDRVMNYNIYNKAFYPYTIDTSFTRIVGIEYVIGSGGTNSPLPMFKYLISVDNSSTTFANDTDGVFHDWEFTGTPVEYESYFVTGYALRGQAQKRFQMPYVYVFSNSEESTAYKIQGMWDYAIARESGRWSTSQLINISNPRFGITHRRHRIRGSGLVLQIRVTSVDSMPFSIIGWSTYETVNQGI